MKTLIIKWLGLAALAEVVADMASYTSQLPAAEEINKLLERVKELEEKVNDLEEPDMSDYVREDDINDRIESYCNDYDIPNKEWIESEIEEKVKEAIDNAGIEEQVRDLFNDASPSPMSEQEIKAEIQESVKVVLEKMVKALADQK